QHREVLRPHRPSGAGVFLLRDRQAPLPRHAVRGQGGAADGGAEGEGGEGAAAAGGDGRAGERRAAAIARAGTGRGARSAAAGAAAGDGRWNASITGRAKSEIRSTKSETNPNQAEGSKFKTEGSSVSVIAYLGIR